ncbi:MAG: hypothetical protein AAF757_01605 [Cyanobacteria bacterium P01_D01_bin.116]
MDIENLSLRELQNLERFIPGLGRFPSRFIATDYNKFIEILYDDIDDIIYQIQENPELRQKDSEDRLTIDIRDQLRRLGYDAAHDSKFGGHADLLVKKGNFTWIGEAKIHSSYNYLWEGFLQLTTRYSTGDSNQRDGGIFIYIRQKNASAIVEKWKDYLLSKELKGYSYEASENREISFFSTHKHEGSGQDFRIKHIPVILYFQPQDKSGRSKIESKS